MDRSSRWPHDPTPAFEGAKRWVLRAFDHASRRIALGLAVEPAHTGRHTEALLQRLLRNPALAGGRERQQLRRLYGLAPAAVNWAVRHREERHWLDWDGFRAQLARRCDQLLHEPPPERIADDGD